jgi:hypothetical protein
MERSVFFQIKRFTISLLGLYVCRNIALTINKVMSRTDSRNRNLREHTYIIRKAGQTKWLNHPENV